MVMRPSWIDDGSEIADPFGYGERAVTWLRKIKHPKNPGPGRPFQLDPWQERIVRRIYGPRDSAGNRIVRRVVLLLPRGNRKTSLAAGLTLLHLIGPERTPGGLVVSAASAHEQARELFNEAAIIVKATASLGKHLTVRDYTSTITFGAERNRYVALSAKGSAHHGKTPNVAILDELHAWTGAEGLRLYEAIDSAMVKVSGTLTVIATTSGRGQENLAWRSIEYAMKVQRGEIDDPATLPVVFAAEADDPWQDETVWHAVNPGLRHGYPDLAAFRDKAAKAVHSPMDRDSFLQFNLNVWLDASTSPFVEMAVYDRGHHEVDLADMEARQVSCFVGVDLSKNEDLTAVVACFRDGDDYWIHPMFFCPQDALRSRGERHSVDYVEWAKLGYIIPTPGAVVDLRTVEDHIRELAATYAVKEIAFDATYGRTMMANLNDDGIQAVEFRQGWISMAPAVQQLERAILSDALHHGGNPILRWNFSNVQIETDRAGNRMMSKAKSGNKIDGAVATVMAVARAAAGVEAFSTSAAWFDDSLFEPI